MERRLPPSEGSRRPRLAPSRTRRAWLYLRATGRVPPVLHPRTFTEKLNWRVLFDRRALLAGTCDKLAMKERAQAVQGLVRIPETHWAGTDVADLADVGLPEWWVLKPNHSCRRVLFGSGPADPEHLARRTAGWVAEQYWRVGEEWAYSRARPALLVEELVGEPARAPVDLKVLVLDGEPQLVEVHSGRGPAHRTRLFTPDWEPLPWTMGHPAGPDTAAPENLKRMLKAATELAAGFDMLRVDFYEEDGELWFGELTPYPGGGFSGIEPELDRLLGQRWTLPRTGPRRFAR